MPRRSLRHHSPSPPRRRIGALAAAALCVLLPAAAVRAQGRAPAASPAPSTTPVGALVADGNYRIAFLSPDPEDPFWGAVQAGVAEQAVAAGVAVDVFAAASPSAAAQLAQMGDVVAGGYDGVLLGPVDARAAVPTVDAANAAAIPVVALDTEPAAGNLVTLVETDDAAAGRAIGEFLLGAIGGAGEVLNLRGNLADQAARDRDRGLREALAADEDVLVVNREAAWDPIEAGAIVAELLPEAGDGTPPAEGRLGPGAIFAANDAMALAAVDAALAAGRDDVVVAGFGGSAEAVAAVADGSLAATVAEFPARVGTLGVDLLVRHLNGEAVPPRVDAGFQVVSDDNVDLFAGRAREVPRATEGGRRW
jgi:ribose transport system substrate-binding protein